MAQPSADYEHYKRIKLLGEGAFGKAFLAECVSDNSLCVIKQVDLSKMSEQEKKDTLKEATVLQSFNHPNIVKFKEVYKTKKGKLCIVMDYADGGDLAGKIKAQRNQPFPETQVLDWFTQICLAIKHVHDRKIIHRDLKGQNIFLTSANIIKLGDFGIARVLSSTRENARTMVGTPYYLSPEIINGKAYSFKSDIWSLGVVLYELCALRPPFDAQSLTFLAMKIVKGQYSPIPTQFSKEMKNLVGALLQVEPSRRPAINEVLKHPAIQNRIQNFLSKSVKIQEFSHTILHNQQFGKNNLKFDQIKNVNNEAPIPAHLLKAQQQQEALQKANAQKPNLQPAPAKPVQPALNHAVSPAKDEKIKIPDPPQSNRPQNNQPQPQVMNNAAPKQNYHYRNSPNFAEPEPYKGPKIVDASKEKAPEPKNVAQPAPWQMKSPEEKARPDVKPKVSEPPKNGVNRPQNPFYQGEPQNRPQPQQQNPVNRVEPVKKNNEREILGGGLGGGGLVMNFAPALKNQKDVGKKPNVMAPGNSGNKKAAAAPAKKAEIDAKKEKEAQQKFADMKKKIEAEKIKKEKKALEEAERKQVAENQRNEREKEREAAREKMRADMNKRKEAFKRGGSGMEVEICGYQTNSLTDLKEPIEEEKQEEVVKNEKVGKVEKGKPVKAISRSKDEKESRDLLENTKETEEEEEVKPKKGAQQGKFARNKVQRGNAKKDDKFGVEIFLPGGNKYDGTEPYTDQETQEETKMSEETANTEDPQKQDPFIEKLEEKIEQLEEKDEPLDEKEIEQMQNISAYFDVLNKTVKQEIDVGGESELTNLDAISSRDLDQEDRDDDEDSTDLTYTQTNDQLKKFNVDEEESMEYIMDYSKLEMLKMKLENILGHDIFLKAYRVAKDLLQNQTLDEIESKYGKGGDSYASLFPFMTKEAREHDLGFVFTYVICEEKAEADGY